VKILFLSLSAFNTSAATNKVVIANRTYPKVNLIGNGVFDGVHLRSKSLDDSMILNITTQEVFGVDSIFLANFEGNLEAGNYTTVSKPITKWRVRRKLVGNFTPKLLGDVDSSVVTYTDYLQANKTSYEYQLSSVADDGTEGAPITSIAESDFFGWCICSTDNQTIYKFDMEVQSDSVVLNMDVKVFEGFTQYPTTRTGKRKYRTGGLKTIPYHYSSGGISNWYVTPYSSGGTTIDNTLLREIETFISNGQPKLLKNTSGDLFKVETSDFSYQYMDKIGEQPYTIYFKWTQVGDGE
jgi:hypothetical protein